MGDSLFIFLGCTLCLVTLMGLVLILYRHLVVISESYWISALVFSGTLAISILSILLLPLDVFVVSRGTNAQIPSLQSLVPTRELLSTVYLSIFSCSILMAYIAIPFAYFYGGASGSDFDIDSEPCERSCTAMRNTSVFAAFICVLVLCGLMLRKGHPSDFQDWDKEAEWLREVLDVSHAGTATISFCVACLCFVGCGAWISYTAYGLAALPASWLRGKQTAAEQRREIEQDLDNINARFRSVQMRYGHNQAQSSEEWTSLQKKQRILSVQTHRLEELEKMSTTWISKIFLVLVPFRVLVGATLLLMSLTLVTSLALSSYDRFTQSRCGFQCGYILEGSRLIWNPLDDVLIFLSEYFPADFIGLVFIAIHVFSCSLHSIMSLGIRIGCVPIYRISPHRTRPEGLLTMAFTMIHVLMVLNQMLLTLAPNYSSFGPQTFQSSDGALQHCSLSAGPEKCSMSVAGSFHRQISLITGRGMFALGYFMANILFCASFTASMVYCFLIRSPERVLKGNLDEVEDYEEEKALFVQLEKIT